VALPRVADHRQQVRSMVSVKDSVIYAGPDRRVVTEVPVTESARDASDGDPAYADPNNARVRGLPTVRWTLASPFDGWWSTWSRRHMAKARRHCRLADR
jgi:hypothetical protein